MTEDLELLLGKAEGEAPDPDFVATLRKRIIAETTEPVQPIATLDQYIVLPDHDDVLELDVSSEPDRRPLIPKWLVAAAAAIGIVIAGTVLATTRPTTVTTIDEPPSFDPNASLIADERSYFDAGTYLIDSVGTPFTLTTDQEQYVLFNTAGQIVIAHPGYQGANDRDMTFARLSSLSDPSQPALSLDGERNSWRADDFSGWLDNVSDQIVITDRQEATVGGFQATRADIEIGESDCQLGVDSCMLFGTNRSVDDHKLVLGPKYRIWVVDQGDEDPLVVIVSVDRESDLGWFDTAETIIASLAFGDIGSNPILATFRVTAEGSTVGMQDLPFLGGIRANLNTDSSAIQDPTGFGRIELTGWEAATAFLTNPLDLDGNELDTSDEVVAQIRAAGVEVTEIEGTTIDGIDTRTFEIGAGSTTPTLKLVPDGERAWSVPLQARMWLVEHPDRGLLIITAEASENADIAFPLILAQTEEIVESLEFIDLD